MLFPGVGLYPGQALRSLHANSQTHFCLIPAYAFLMWQMKDFALYCDLDALTPSRPHQTRSVRAIS